MGELLERPWMRWLLHGLGGGTAVALGIAAIDAVKQHPEFLPQLLNGNFLFFCALVVGMVVFRQDLRQFNEMHGRLAEGIERIAQRDDERAREQDITLNYLARNSDKHLEQQEEILKRLEKLGV